MEITTDGLIKGKIKRACSKDIKQGDLFNKDKIDEKSSQQKSVHIFSRATPVYVEESGDRLQITYFHKDKDGFVKEITSYCKKPNAILYKKSK